MDELKNETIALGDDIRLHDILEEICALTGMGFAAVARVTENRWVTCQVLDKIDFGLDPGDELKIRETICDEIRDSGEAVVFDDASDDIKWSRHPVPVIYGFKAIVPSPSTSTTVPSSAPSVRSTRSAAGSATMRSS